MKKLSAGNLRGEGLRQKKKKEGDWRGSETKAMSKQAGKPEVWESSSK